MTLYMFFKTEHIKKALELNHLFLKNSLLIEEYPPARHFLLDERKCSLSTVNTYKLRYVGKVDFSNVPEVVNNFFLAKSLGLYTNVSGKIVNTFQDCIVFPYEVPYYGVLSFGFRRLEKKEYFNSPNTFLFTKEWGVFGLSQALPEVEKTNWIIIVEGYFDVLRLHQLGFRNVVGTAGTAISLHKLAALRRYSQNFLLLFDSDSAGRIAMEKTKKLLSQLSPLKVVSVELPCDKDIKVDPDSFGIKEPEKLKAILNSNMWR